MEDVGIDGDDEILLLMIILNMVMLVCWIIEMILGKGRRITRPGES